MRYTINWRFLLVSAVVGVVTLVSVHFLHRWQVRQQVGVFLREADAARDDKNVEREMAYLKRYVAVRPDAVDERDRFARLLAASAKGAKQRETAYLTLDDVLRRDPTRDDLRRYTIDFALTLGDRMRAEAIDHIDKLLKKDPKDGELLAKRAACLLADRKFDEAAADYEKAYTTKPDLLEAYVARALVLREHPAAAKSREDTADAVVRRMVDANPANFRAHLLDADYRRLAERTAAEVEAAVAKARELAPDEVEVILASSRVAVAAADRARADGDRERFEAKTAEAKAELDRGLKLHPDAVPLFLARAGIEANPGTPAAAANAAAVLAPGTERLPDNATLWAARAEYQLNAADATAAAALDKLEKLGHPPALVAFGRARLRMIRGEWLTAIRALEKLLADGVRDPDLGRQVNLQLGRCYEQIGDADRRVTAYARAVPDLMTDRLWVPAQFGLAEAYAAAGRTDDALKAYERLADRAPAAWVPIARLRTLRALQAGDPAKADWGSAEQAVERANKVLPDDTEARLLKANLAAFRNRPEEARKLIDAVFAERPKEPAAWVAKATQLARDGSADAAADLLKKGRAELGDPVELRLAAAAIAAESKDPGAVKPVLTELAEGTEKYPPRGAAERRLLRGLAEVATRVGADDLAGDLWDRLADRHPDDLSVHLARFEHARRANATDRVQQALNEIRRLDGAAGPTARSATAWSLIWRAVGAADKAGLDEALRLLDQLENERPGWPRVALGKGIALGLLDRPDEALSSLQKAVAAGDYTPEVLRLVVSQLNAKGRVAEANELLAKLPPGSAGGREAQRLAAEVALRGNNLARALEYAKQAVPATATDPADLLWLGQMHWAAGDRAAAEPLLRKAVTLKPDYTAGWLALIQYLSATGRQPEAAAEFERAKGRVPKDAVGLFTAQAALSLGRAAEAAAAFEQARKERPADRAVLTAEANFLTNAGRLSDARAAWERVLTLPGASDDQKQEATRMLAVCLAADPDFATAKRAVEVLAAATSSTPKTAAERRTRAVVLALQRDVESKRQAIKLLEADPNALTPTDRFLLAQVYDQVGDDTAVRATMTALLLENGKSPLFLTYFARWLLAQNEPTAAERWVKQLEEVAPDSPATDELKVLVLAGKKDPDGAREMLRQVEKRADPPYGFLAAVAERAELYPEAERYLRRLADAVRADNPQVDLAVARFLARRNRLAEALDLCDRAWATCPPQAVAEASVFCLTAATDPDPTSLKRVAERIEAAKAKNPAFAPAMLFQLALVRNLEGRFDDAIAIYRDLTGGPTNAVALNNLAYLLSARHERHDEALGLIEQAKRTAGPLPDLLDTEAMIRTARGTPADFDTARRLLQDVIAVLPKPGSAYFHLAVLEQKANKPTDSRLAWREAKRRELQATDLHPLEWPAFRQMEAAYK